jgi:sulfate/thiosulfate transport system ATP-binding protein
MSIQIKNVSKKFGQFAALDDVSLEIPSGELVALLGPSGSGKTTLLRVIAGLEFPESGSILFEDEDITDRTARDRRVGFVFQHYALFRHMTVFENIAFGLRVRPRGTRPSKSEIRDKVHELLKLIQLQTLASRYPSQLSGGQRQRVALARWLSNRKSCFWTNLLVHWTQKSGWNYGVGCGNCMMKFISPACSSHMIRMRRSKSRIVLLS